MEQAQISDADLPGVWRDADESAAQGQRWTLILTGSKVGGGVLAALGGVIALDAGGIGLGPWAVLIGFSIALASELASWAFQPEKNWYDGRAVAESAKTLAWRYAVGADPFPASMPRTAAEELFRGRMSLVADQVSERIIFRSPHPVITPRMDELRQLPFADRRLVYIEGRTLDQSRWYSRKAGANRRRANIWRFLLVAAEVAAVSLAVGRVSGAWDVDLAGLLAAVIGAGTAWVAVKQFSPLASAYSVATKELALQATRLGAVSEERWPLEAADAEEAISREHTTWIASRTGRATYCPGGQGDQSA